MRILMVTRGLPFHSAGGMEAVSWDLAKCFASLSNEVTVLTTRASTLPMDSIVDGVRIRCVDAPTARYSADWWRQSRAVHESEFAVWADVVLSVSAGAMEIAASSGRGRARFFVQAHGTAWGEAVSKLRMAGLWPKLTALKNIRAMINDRKFRAFDGFIAVGEKVEQDIRSAPTRWVVGNMPVSCVPNGVAPEVFAFDPNERLRLREDYGIPENARVGLAASRLHAQKGIVESLLGFARLRSQGKSSVEYLLIAGNGPDRERIEDHISRNGLGEFVRMVGHVDRSRMKSVMSAADYFLFTTLRVEGLPMNVLEARANGLPVILSQAIDHPDFGAMAVDPSSPSDIATAIDTIRGGVDRASLLPERYTLSACAKAYLSIFEGKPN